MASETAVATSFASCSSLALRSPPSRDTDTDHGHLDQQERGKAGHEDDPPHGCRWRCETQNLRGGSPIGRQRQQDDTERHRRPNPSQNPSPNPNPSPSQNRSQNPNPSLSPSRLRRRRRGRPRLRFPRRHRSRWILIGRVSSARSITLAGVPCPFIRALPKGVEKKGVL